MDLEEVAGVAHARRLTKTKIIGFSALGLLIIAIGVGLYVFIDSTPIKDSAKELEHHTELLNDEALLGKSKEEIKKLLGTPDSWRVKDNAMSFPGGMDIWDERIHVWGYTSSDGETRLNITFYFSDNETVDYILPIFYDLESNGSWREPQGTKNAYS